MSYPVPTEASEPGLMLPRNLRKGYSYRNSPTSVNGNGTKPGNAKISRSPTASGLVTTDGGTLYHQFGHKMGGSLSPLERIALTANGNLQRIFSSYYDAPVHVHVDYCQKRTDDCSVNTWERRVMLIVHSKVSSRTKIAAESKMPFIDKLDNF